MVSRIFEFPVIHQFFILLICITAVQSIENIYKTVKTKNGFVRGIVEKTLLESHTVKHLLASFDSRIFSSRDKKLL